MGAFLEIKPQEKIHTVYGDAKLHHTGYYLITTSKEGNAKKPLHRLIYETFYGKIPEGCVIHHKDGNKLNNCVNNLQLLAESEHNKLHHINQNISEEHKINLSKSLTITGIYRVKVENCKKCKNGVVYRYSYVENGKVKSITSVDISKLEQKVKERGFTWKILDEEKASKILYKGVL